MWNKLIGQVISWLLETFVTKENYREMDDDILDFFERLAAKTSNEIDDAVVAKIRAILNVPDGDD